MLKKLTDDEKSILFFIAHLPSPVSIDTLIALSGFRPVNILNILELLNTKKIVFEKKKYGKGLYFLKNPDLADRFRTEMTGGKTPDTIRKIINFYFRSPDQGEETIVVLADLYLKLGDVAEGLPYIKKAADILYQSGQRERAIVYYDHIIQSFSDIMPEQGQAEDYLSSVCKRIAVLPVYHKDPQLQLTFLEHGLEVAKNYQHARFEAEIKLQIGCLLPEVDQKNKATRYINAFWKIAQKLNDEELTNIGVLMTSVSMVLKGSVAKATDYYEKMTGGLEKFEGNDEYLTSRLLLANSHVVCGRIARGLGMIEAVSSRAHSVNYREGVCLSNLLHAFSLVEIRKTSEAEFYLNKFSENAQDSYAYTINETYCRCKAYLLCAKQDYKAAFEFLKKGHSTHYLQVTPWFFECLHTLESKGYFDEEMDLDSEIRKILTWDNRYLKGIALRYRAIKTLEKGQLVEDVYKDLKLSEKYLKQVGANIELARTRITLGNYYLKKNQMSRGKSYLEKARLFLSRIDKDLFPKDLLEAIPREQKIDIIIDRISTINQSIGVATDVSSFLEKVINALMDFTMAARGAFLSLEEGVLKIRASRNISVDFFDTKGISSVKEVIVEAIKKEKELIIPKDNKRDDHFHRSGITSFMGMPVKLGNRNYGYLVLDSQINETIFSEHSISFVRMLAGQMALGLYTINSFEASRALKERFEDEATFYKKELRVDTPFEAIIGQSEGMRKVIDQVWKVAPTDISVLILGETGVGKEIVTKSIHNLSKRKDGPFIPVNLAVLPQDLVASELFGHEKGSFTGAHEKQKGRFELADGGTIFLDEIGDLPLNFQTKLLRVLQEGTFERLGKATAIPSNFRVIAATNKNLRVEVEKGKFREDLFYRLNNFPIYVPPLRERKEDISLLAQHFLKIYSKKIGKKIGRIPPGEIRKLESYRWPGNVRELEHVIQRAAILSDGNTIRFSGLDDTPVQDESSGVQAFMSMKDMEQQHIINALNATQWRISGPNGAAVLLGLTRSSLRHKVKKLGITRPYTPVRPK